MQTHAAAGQPGHETPTANANMAETGDHHSPSGQKRSAAKRDSAAAKQAGQAVPKQLPIPDLIPYMGDSGPGWKVMALLVTVLPELLHTATTLVLVGMVKLH